MIDFAKDGRVLYISMVDISQPKGPSVNEREFLASLFAGFGSRVHAIVPRPETPCADIDVQRTTFYTGVANRRIAKLAAQQVRLWRLARRLVNSFRPDLIVARTGFLPLSIYLLSKDSVPIYLKTVGDPQGFLEKSRGLRRVALQGIAPVHCQLLSRLLQRVVGADTCTTELRDLVCSSLGYPEQKMAIVENSTNVARFRPDSQSDSRRRLGIASHDPLLGYIGGMPAQRGGMELLQVTKRLMADYPNIGVAVVGKCESNELNLEAERLGIQDRAILPGLVPYEEVPDYVNSLDIGYATGGVQWSNRVGNSYQKVRQYLACGKPIVTCNSGDPIFFESNLAEPVDPGDVDMIETATRKILARDAQQQQVLRSRAIEMAKTRYSIEAALEHRIQLFNEAIACIPRLNSAA